MRSGKNYLPCIRWKQGEYLALERLSPIARNRIMPLIEVAELGFDFEAGKEIKSIDKHLSLFAKRVIEKWGKDECFVDLRLIDTRTHMMNGDHVLTFIFNDLRTKDANAIPVIGISHDSEYQNAVRYAIKSDGRGVCIRVNLEDATEPNFSKELNNLILNIGVSPKSCDFILDLGAPPNFEPIIGFTHLLEIAIKTLPYLSNWRSFGLIGTSFPSSLSGIKTGVTFLYRNEWLLYKELVKVLKKSDIRIPTFGDYVINHPDVSNVDMRFMKPKANVRYTLENSWLIARGENIKDYGLEQHEDLCKLVAANQGFYGAPFSVADKYIEDCAQGSVSTGNLTTWRWVGTNHHLEVVARDVAKFAAS